MAATYPIIAAYMVVQPMPGRFGVMGNAPPPDGAERDGVMSEWFTTAREANIVSQPAPYVRRWNCPEEPVDDSWAQAPARSAIVNNKRWLSVLTSPMRGQAERLTALRASMRAGSAYLILRDESVAELICTVERHAVGVVLADARGPVLLLHMAIREVPDA